MSIKRMAKSSITHVIRATRKVPAIRKLLDAEVMRTAALDPSMYRDRPWTEIDRVFTFCRRALRANPAWRQGPIRVREVAKEGYDAIHPHIDLQGKTFCDLGCGVHHPFGISAVMFLNGAAAAIALDIEKTSKARAAEALADLLEDCICFPNRWNWSGTAPTAFMTRVGAFNLEALAAGRLEEGLCKVPIRHVVTDIHNTDIEVDAIDVMTSRAVLEHFMNFETAAQRLYDLMRKGGVACHHIDLVDHRAYVNTAFHHWSFMAENEGWSDGLINQLRACEIRPLLEKAGFEILRYDLRRGRMPPGFMNQVKGRYRTMSEEELSVTGIFCVLKKP